MTVETLQVVDPSTEGLGQIKPVNGKDVEPTWDRAAIYGPAQSYFTLLMRKKLEYFEDK